MVDIDVETLSEMERRLRRENARDPLLAKIREARRKAEAKRRLQRSSRDWPEWWAYRTDSPPACPRCGSPEQTEGRMESGSKTTCVTPSENVCIINSKTTTVTPNESIALSPRSWRRS